MNRFIAITIGDIGIGIHILLIHGRKIKNFILFSDVNIIKNLLRAKNITSN